MAKEKHWKRIRSQAAIMRDLLRLRNAPVTGGEVSQLYLDIKAEVAKVGLPESDADWFYKKMQRDGWRFEGVPIEDWRYTIASFHKHKFFLSQR